MNEKKILFLITPILATLLIAGIYFFFYDFLGKVIAALIYGMLTTTLGFWIQKYFNKSKVVSDWTYSSFLKDVRNSKKEVLIYTTYSDILITNKVEGQIDLTNEFKKILQTKFEKSKCFKLRVLILDPASYAARQRNKERISYNADDDVVKSIKNNINTLLVFLEFFDKYKDRIEIKISNMTPRFQMHKTDTRINLDFYPIAGKASNSKNTICFHPKSDLGIYFLNAFEEVWGQLGNTGKKYIFNESLVIDEYLRTDIEIINKNSDHVIRTVNVKYIFAREADFYVLLDNPDDANRDPNDEGLIEFFTEKNRENYDYKLLKNNKTYTKVVDVKGDVEYYHQNHQRNEIKLKRTAEAKYDKNSFIYFEISRPLKDSRENSK